MVIKAVMIVAKVLAAMIIIPIAFIIMLIKTAQK